MERFVCAQGWCWLFRSARIADAPSFPLPSSQNDPISRFQNSSESCAALSSKLNLKKLKFDILDPCIHRRLHFIFSLHSDPPPIERNFHSFVTIHTTLTLTILTLAQAPSPRCLITLCLTLFPHEMEEGNRVACVVLVIYIVRNLGCVRDQQRFPQCSTDEPPSR